MPRLFSAGAALLVLSLLAPRPVRALPPDTWLVAIADNQGDRDETRLLYATRDAEQLVDVMQSQGGVQARLTTVLNNRSADEVREALLDINARIRERSTHVATALVVYYSGHADADALHLDGTHLRFDDLRALVRGSPAATRLLVVDACRSGSVTHVKGVRPVPPTQIELATDSGVEGLAILTSSAAGESSQESDRLRSSFFTHHLVNALRGAADQNDDGVITLTEAYDYAYAQTLRSSGRTLELQHPTYSFDVKGRDEIILTRPREATGHAGQLRLGEAVSYVISERGEGGAIAAEVAPVQARALLALPAGRYFVQERRPDEDREYLVDIEDTRETVLSDVPYQSVRYDRLVRARGGASRSFVHGLTLLAGAHGTTLPGESVPPQVVLGYGLDLPWLSVGLRARAADASFPGGVGVPGWQHREAGLGIALQRFVDLKPFFSLSFGVIAEATLHEQVFTGPRAVPARTVAGGSFAGLVSIERVIWNGVAVRVEGGPVTEVFEYATAAMDGEAQRPSLISPFTWWADGGIVWRF